MQQQPKDDAKYSWTHHAWIKMQQYGIGEGRVKRIVRFPKRIEEGIAPQTVAVMQPGGSSKYHEIWVMYKLIGKSPQSQPKEISNLQFLISKQQKIKIITAWRYPGHSPERDPIPSEVIQEIQSLL